MPEQASAINAAGDTCVLVFSGYNDRAVLSFLRTLEKYQVLYAVVAAGEHDRVLSSSYRNKVIHTRESSELSLEVISQCIALAKRGTGAVRVWIAPSTEALNRFMLDNRTSLEQQSVVVPLANQDCYENISDKLAFTRLCEAAGLLVPGEFADWEKAQLPFVAKPKNYLAGDGSAYSPVLIFNESEKHNFASQYDPRDFYFQQYLEGKSVYLLYYFSTDGSAYSFSQENIAQQPGGKSIVAAVSSTYHEAVISDQYIALFESLGFTGLVMVELRVTKDGPYMIEANPRFWGPSQLFIDAGVTFFERLLADYGILTAPVTESSLVEAKYCWFGGIMQSLKEGKELDFPGYDPAAFYAALDVWVSHDIYKRADSLDIFRGELH